MSDAEENIIAAEMAAAIITADPLSAAVWTEHELIPGMLVPANDAAWAVIRTVKDTYGLTATPEVYQSAIRQTMTGKIQDPPVGGGGEVITP